MSNTALSVGKYILSLQDPDAGDLISNLKLQKLLYYCQGCCLRLRGISKPLFVDRILAWEHGPVVRAVYENYAQFGKGALPIEAPASPLPPADAELINEVYRVFGKFSAWKLRQMTHEEDPWKDNYRHGRLNIEIPREDMVEYFKRYVKKG